VAKLAGRVLVAAIEDASRGDRDAREWLADPAAIEPWADVLRVSPGRLVSMAARVLR
jgi:hypothetical protein